MSEEIYDVASKAYVRFVLDEMRLSPSALAKKAGIASTTLTRALNDPTHKYTLSMSTLGKIMKVSGISVQPFFDAKDFAAMALSPHSREDFYLGPPLGRQNISEQPTPMNMTYVIGQAAAGVWKNPQVASSGETHALAIALPMSNETDVFALEMADESAAPFVRKGEFAICRRVTDELDDRSILHGDLLAVERWMSGLMEISLRRAVVPQGDGKPYLKLDGGGPQFSENIPLPENKDLSAKIIGSVAFAVRDVQDPVMTAERRARPPLDPFPQ